MVLAADRQIPFANDCPGGEPWTAQTAEFHRCHFSVSRADSIRVTSTKFVGGDWRWRLSDQVGAILVEAGGYRSEAHCREAVAILRARAAHATVA